MQITLVCGLATGLAITAVPGRADEDELRDTGNAAYWIGVHAVPIDQALRSHLQLEDRLIVVQVMPDSPAAEAGLKQHDILLKFDDRELTSMAELVSSVRGSNGKAAIIAVLRAGKEISIRISPAKRPEGTVELPVELPDWKPLQWWRDSDTKARGFRLVGPGFIIGRPDPLPNDVSINIRKENDEPTKITVKRADDKWEVTEETIDELPDELREPIRRHLEGNSEDALIPNTSIFRLPKALAGGRAIIHITPRLGRADGDIPKILRGSQRRLQPDPFKALEEQIEGLRREVEKLRDERSTDHDRDD